MKKISEADDDLNEFLNKVVKYSLITWQADLSSSNVSPVDEGRLRSNWFAKPDTSSKAKRLTRKTNRRQMLSSCLWTIAASTT